MNPAAIVTHYEVWATYRPGGPLFRRVEDNIDEEIDAKAVADRFQAKYELPADQVRVVRVETRREVLPR